jgi:chromosome segregation and condensation protein ScpB
MNADFISTAVKREARRKLSTSAALTLAILVGGCGILG